MNLTVLIDLDNTLLMNDMAVFQPAYFKKLAGYLSEIPPETLFHYLMAGTRQMMEKTQPELTLEEAFNAVFYPGLDIQKAEYRSRLDDFYLHHFPALKTITQPRKEAVALINWIIENEGAIAIATNPLFPRLAILERLRWANLPPEKYPFALIPSFETMHFAKPHQAYFMELLSQMGWREQPAVMIGDDLEMDIQPAMALGLPVYWVTEQVSPLIHEHDHLSSQGDIAGVQAWLSRIDQANINQTYDKPNQLSAVLSATPATLDTLCRHLPAEILAHRPAPEEWSITEILCHLRDVDQCVNLPRLEKIMREDNPFLPGIDTDRWADEGKYTAEDGLSALNAFIKARSDLLALMDRFTTTDWQRMTRHAIFGPTSLLELVKFITIHDQNHIRQVHTALV